MALKHRTVLSRDDFREALDSQQISISQVAKATGIPRSYLSEFLSIGRPLKPEQLTHSGRHPRAERLEQARQQPDRDEQRAQEHDTQEIFGRRHGALSSNDRFVSSNRCEDHAPAKLNAAGATPFIR